MLLERTRYHPRRMRITGDEMEHLVGEALDLLPEQFAELLDNVAVVVEDEPSEEDLRSVGIDPTKADHDDILGLYVGVPLTERDSFYDALPDRIAIYRLPIERSARDRAEAVDEIRKTVLHELGHHFGMEEHQMPY